jgi:hypothetical protein
MKPGLLLAATLALAALFGPIGLTVTPAFAETDLSSDLVSEAAKPSLKSLNSIAPRDELFETLTEAREAPAIKPGEIYDQVSVQSAEVVQVSDDLSPPPAPSPEAGPGALE